jgi:hypothetical protein
MPLGVLTGGLELLIPLEFSKKHEAYVTSSIRSLFVHKD